MFEMMKVREIHRQKSSLAGHRHFGLLEIISPVPSIENDMGASLCVKFLSE